MSSTKTAVVMTLLITLLVCIIAGGAGFYYLSKKFQNEKSSLQSEINSLRSSQSSSSESSSSTMDTSDWQTYTNAQFGYSFRYPKGYKVSDNCYDSIKKKRIEYTLPKSIVLVNKETQDDFPYCDSDFPQPFFHVGSDDKTADINLEKTTRTADTTSEKTVAGQKWVSFTTTQPSEYDESYSTTLRLNFGGKSYSISWANSDGKGTHDPIIDAMLLSFQFVK